MSLSKTKNGAYKSLSPQMVLLHQRWQQIRQLELQAMPGLSNSQESPTSAAVAKREIACISS